jgi:hypothetical protein
MVILRNRTEECGSLNDSRPTSLTFFPDWADCSSQVICPYAPTLSCFMLVLLLLLLQLQLQVMVVVVLLPSLI